MIDEFLKEAIDAGLEALPWEVRMDYYLESLESCIAGVKSERTQ